MAGYSTNTLSLSQTSDNIRRSTAEKLKLFESIRGKKVDIPFWDVIVITALDESQKDAYDIQLQSKLARGELPLGVKYHVFYDPPGPKIGNGGSVIVTIGDLLKIYDEEELLKSKIMMLPAGGYSQRLPNASVLGKAFTALPIGKWGGGGDRGVGDREKRGREVYGRWEKRGAGSGIPKVAGSGRKREKLRNIVQYFAIEKMQRGGSQQTQGVNQD